MTLVLFLIAVMLINSVEKSVCNYYDDSIYIYRKGKWDEFSSVFDSAYRMGEIGLHLASNDIQADMPKEVDVDELRYSLENNTYYGEFQSFLQKRLQYNVYTLDSTISKNRNEIFVLCNGKVVANYSHDLILYPAPLREGEVIEGNDILDFVQNSYNKELSMNALNLIERQSSDLIVWQIREPSNSDSRKYTKITMATMKAIFEEEGIEGFRSYDVLIPTYITEYGNIFGENDFITGRMNKLIIVQQLNLADYFETFYPTMFYDDDYQMLVRTFVHINTMMSTFEIILYLSIIAYVAFVAFNYNQLIDELENTYITK